jgi:hypothetical protein
MLSLTQIQRLVATGDYRLLVERVLSNGRLDGCAVRSCLTDPRAVVPAALGLALQRACELTYGPAAIAVDLARRLLDQRRGDGLFGTGQTSSIAASAVAIGGLLALFDQCRADGSDVRLALDEIKAAVDSALAALGDLQREDGRLGRDSTDVAIMLWQLGDRAEFRAALRRPDLLSSALNTEDDQERNDLHRLAHAVAA